MPETMALSFRPSAAGAKRLPLHEHLPPATAALLLLDQLRPTPDWHFHPDSPRETLWHLLLDLEGPLGHLALPVFRSLEEGLDEEGPGIKRAELERLCWYRQLLALGRRARLREALEGEITRADHSRLFHCEILHLFALSRGKASKLARKALEREVLLRQDCGSEWRRQRARALLARQQSEEACRQMILRARSQGVQIRLRHLAGQGLPDADCLRDALRLTRPASLGRLLEAWLGRQHVRLRLEFSGWPLLRGLLQALLDPGGPVVEVQAGALPAKLPLEAGCLLVIHQDYGDPPRLPTLPEEGRALWLCPGGPVAEGWTEVGSPLDARLHRTLGGSWLKHPEQVLPLRQFVAQVEGQYIREVLRLHHGVKMRACESLGIARQTLYSKLAETEGLDYH